MDQVQAHSELGGSVVKRLRNCPGSRRLARSVPNVSSRFAQEGTEAHELAAAILEARKLGKPEPDTFGIDDDMLFYVDLYVQHMIDLQAPGCIQLYEHRFSLAKIHPDAFGTADGVTYYPEREHLVISDLKYGAGRYVDVERNDQLLFYALGAVLSLGWRVRTLSIEIIQPRLGEPIRTWDTDIFELWDFADELKEIFASTERDNATLAIGDWCEFCPAAAANICPLMKEKARALTQRVFTDLTAEQIDFNELGKLMQWLPVLEKWISSVREFAYDQALHKRQKIPGYKLVPKRASRHWTDKAIKKLEDHFNDEVIYEPRKLKSPSQLEKAKVDGWKKKDLKEFIEGLVVKSSSGYTLASEDDARKEIKQIDAKSVFVSADENDAFD